MKAQEAHETIEEAFEGNHNKRVAILIAVIAATLAIAEMGGGQAKQDALNFNIEASNLWSFFQAKTIRQTVLRTAAETAEIEATAAAPAKAAAIAKQLDAWKTTVARYESEPGTGEGRKELTARAKAAEVRRDRALAADHDFELASGTLQLGIVLSSAAIITGVIWLAYAAVGLGLIGVVFVGVGLLAPTLLPF